MYTTALLLLLSSISSSSVSPPSIIELDLITFRTLLLKDADRDSLIFFHFSQGAQAANQAASAVARHLNLDASSSIRVAVLDCSIHGIPSGLHLHPPATSLYLFPALEKEPVLFSDNHDHHHHHHHHDDDDDDDEEHDDHSTSTNPFLLINVIDFLREHTTFKAEVPAITLSQRWSGRSRELWEATANGLHALQHQMEELQQELESVKKELSSCKATAASASMLQEPKSNKLEL